MELALPTRRPMLAQFRMSKRETVMAPAKTMFAKLWDAHVVLERDDGVFGARGDPVVHVESRPGDAEQITCNNIYIQSYIEGLGFNVHDPTGHPPDYGTRELARLVRLVQIVRTRAQGRSAAATPCDHVVYRVVATPGHTPAHQCDESCRSTAWDPLLAALEKRLASPCPCAPDACACLAPADRQVAQVDPVGRVDAVVRGLERALQRKIRRLLSAPPRY